MVRVRAMRTLENAARRWGFYRVAGCDEVGRGCLAGPVVAGAVILDPEVHIAGLADSKTITALERERLHDEITRKALAWSVAACEPAEIDAINIHRASLEAMRRALLAIAPLPDLVLVDAFRIPDLYFAQRAVLHGVGWLDHRGSPYTEAMAVTERFRRLNYGRLEIEMTVDDPQAYTKPFTLHISQRIVADGSEMIEFICHENQMFLKLTGRAPR